MILADTNIWIDHLRQGDPRLSELLDADEILMHPWVRGELALGALRNHEDFLSLLALLPELRPMRETEILEMIESTELFGRGIGWVDAGLLAACRAHPCRLWTRDARLGAIAHELGVGE